MTERLAQEQESSIGHIVDGRIDVRSADSPKRIDVYIGPLATPWALRALDVAVTTVLALEPGLEIQRHTHSFIFGLADISIAGDTDDKLALANTLCDIMRASIAEETGQQPVSDMTGPRGRRIRYP